MDNISNNLIVVTRLTTCIIGATETTHGFGKIFSSNSTSGYYYSRRRYYRYARGHDRHIKITTGKHGLKRPK